MEWARGNPRELKWLVELMVRRELGGYCPKDELEFAFMSTIIIFNKEQEVKTNTDFRLQNLIRKSK